MEPAGVHSPEMCAIVEWLHRHVAPLLTSGERCTVTLHIGPADIRADLERKGHVILLKPPKGAREIIRR